MDVYSWQLKTTKCALYSLSGQAFLEFPLFKISKIFNPTNTVEKIFFMKKNGVLNGGIAPFLMWRTQVLAP